MPKRPAKQSDDTAATELRRQTGARLRAIRELAGIKQAEISGVLGVDQSTWSKWETGIREADLLTVVKFAARAQASLDLIYCGLPGGSNPALESKTAAPVVVA